jgi:hypothetical protein
VICSVCGRQGSPRSSPIAATDNTRQGSPRSSPIAGINEHSNDVVARETSELTLSRLPSGAGFHGSASNSIAGQGEINE